MIRGRALRGSAAASARNGSSWSSSPDRSRLITIRSTNPGNAVQIHHGLKAHGVLPPRVATVGSTTVLRGTGAGSADEQRMPHGRRDGHAILDPQLVLPPARRVAEVANLCVRAKPEIRKRNVHRLAVQTWPGVHDAPYAELKEVDRFPSHRHLEHAMKFVRRHGVRHATRLQEAHHDASGRLTPEISGFPKIVTA